jgi:DNA-binding NarL/FixJ family response regulator
MKRVGTALACLVFFMRGTSDVFAANPGACCCCPATCSLRDAHPEARIIFISVLDEPAVIRKALAEGALGYVIKSDAGDKLADALQAVLGGGLYVSSSARHALKSAH